MLTRQIKKQILDLIIATPSFLGKYDDYDGVLTFLNKIWNLREMPSTDPRYKTAYEDAHQHLVNNKDWDTEYLFVDRFKLLDGDENYFILFIEAMVNPITRKTKDEIIQFVSKINLILQSTGFKLILTDYFEELPVYKYKDSAELSDLPIDIIANNIPIYLEGNEIHKQYPHFTLTYNNWNDYGFTTTSYLMYYQNASTFRGIGRVKIMKRNTESTWETFPREFSSLSVEYCSLGQDKDYYIALKKTLGNTFYGFLLAIRDVAIFPRIQEQFENDKIYKESLLRGNEAERLARTIRFELEDISPNEYYKFTFTHKPPYAENTIHLNFDFEYNTTFEHRIFALIGKNGTGKTRILSALAKNLSEKDTLNFSPRKPVYGKVFSVSYSFFDRFEIPNPDASFNYVYCGLKKDQNRWKSEEELLAGFYNSVQTIKEKKLETDWYNILLNFIDQDLLEMMFEIYTFLTKNYVFNENKFDEVRKTLSSGETIILFLISEILAQIRFDSLILFDEPETHLHPNAITSLVNTLFSLVNRFQSFCIIATHSPLIIQEIPARNIFVIERENESASVRGLERESLGENLTVITQDIFGNRDVPKHFIGLIEDLISKGKSYAEIIEILESDSLPIPSNIRLYIKALTPAR